MRETEGLPRRQPLFCRFDASSSICHWLQKRGVASSGELSWWRGTVSTKELGGSFALTARRSAAVIGLFAVIFSLIPAPRVAASESPAYVPVLRLQGNLAVIDGDLLYAMDVGQLRCYELSSQRLIGSVEVGAAAAMTMLDQLYLLTVGGVLQTYAVQAGQLVQTGSVEFAGLWGRSEPEQQGPLAKVDDRRLITLVENRLFLLNQRTGTVEWQYQVNGQTGGQFTLLGQHVFVNVDYGVLQGIEIGGGVVYSGECGSWLGVADNRGAQPSLYFPAKRNSSVQRLHFDQNGQAVVETWLQPLDQYAEIWNGSIHQGKFYYTDGGYFSSCDLTSGEKQRYQTCPWGPIWVSDQSDAYWARSNFGITQVRDDRYTYGTAIPDYVAGLAASGESGFVLRSDRRELWVYARAEQTTPSRQLTFGQTHMFMLHHPAAGPVSFNVSSVRDGLALRADVQVLLLDQGSGEVTLWDAADLSQQAGFAVYEEDVPAGTLLVMVTATSDDEQYDAEHLAKYPQWATPISYRLSCGVGVELGEGEIPDLRITSPWPRLELWGEDGAVSSTTVQVQTEPNTWVYSVGGNSTAQADSNGDLSWVLPIASDSVSMLQVLAGQGENAALMTVPVYRHWALRRPGEAPSLSRTPAFYIAVPDASQVDLANSTLQVAGDSQNIPLYADLKNNLIYGVPTWSLQTGELQLVVQLVSKATGAGAEPIVLDQFTWDQEIVGARTAELWPDKLAATVNGAQQTLEAAPYIHAASSSTMLPFRFVADVMGAQVTWNAQSKQVTFKLDDQTVVLIIGSRTAKVNGRAVTMATAPAIVNGRAMVPLRFVSESLGANVNWSNSERKVTIKVAAHPLEG